MAQSNARPSGDQEMAGWIPVRRWQVGSQSGDGRLDPSRVWQHSLVKIDREIISTVILSLLLIQEGQLSVSGERMCTNTG